jgi:hypothetical protein
MAGTHGDTTEPSEDGQDIEAGVRVTGYRALEEGDLRRLGKYSFINGMPCPCTRQIHIGVYDSVDGGPT